MNRSLGKMLVGNILATAAIRFPDSPAIYCSSTDRRFTFRETNERANRLAQALLAAGLRKGDVVAFLSSNRAEIVEIYFALSRTGIIGLPLELSAGGNGNARIDARHGRERTDLREQVRHDSRAGRKDAQARHSVRRREARFRARLRDAACGGVEPGPRYRDRRSRSVSISTSPRARPACRNPTC